MDMKKNQNQKRDSRNQQRNEKKNQNQKRDSRKEENNRNCN